MNIYLELTREFNQGGMRAILAGGQAVVLHRLAMMSKDGDWILREDVETTERVLEVLESHDAHYRFGAPLDIRWLSGGWSSHLEFVREGLRVRADFVTRPPRLGAERLARIWSGQAVRPDLPCLGARDLADTKKTNREKDYAVIGELARAMTDADDRILYSRSARDLMAMAGQYPDRFAELSVERPALAAAKEGLEALESSLDAERRRLIHANEQRLARYMAAAEEWAKRWPDVNRRMQGLSLSDAHAIMVKEALKALPCENPEGVS